MEYNLGSNRASNFKSATLELYDKKSYYQLIVPITKLPRLSKSIVLNKLSKSKEKMSE